MPSMSGSAPHSPPSLAGTPARRIPCIRSAVRIKRGRGIVIIPFNALQYHYNIQLGVYLCFVCLFIANNKQTIVCFVIYKQTIAIVFCLLFLNLLSC